MTCIKMHACLREKWSLNKIPTLWKMFHKIFQYPVSLTSVSCYSRVATHLLIDGRIDKHDLRTDENAALDGL